MRNTLVSGLGSETTEAGRDIWPHKPVSCTPQGASSLWLRSPPELLLRSSSLTLGAVKERVGWEEETMSNLSGK